MSNLLSRERAAIGVFSTLLLGFVLVMSAGSLVERVDAGETVVLQDPIDGELHVWADPGLHFQGFGQVTTYTKSQQVWFTLPTEEHSTDTSATTRFNDGGKAWVSGSMRYDLPSDYDSMVALHTKYRSPSAVHEALVIPTIEKSIYMSGPLMSSTESYAARRGELIDFVQDQTQNGTYKTTVQETTTVDTLTGEDTVVKITKIVTTSDGIPLRQENSPFEEFGIQTRNLVLNGIRYDEDVQRQIDAQREMTMAIQTSKARSLQAEQDAITAEERGKADAATARWEQEVEKAVQVTKAERDADVAALDANKRLEVQRLATESAKLFKEEQRLIGEGEGARKRAVMQADGALKQKLATYERVQANWAKALATTQVVPNVVMGSSGNGGSANDFVQLMTLQAAKDLNLDLQTK